MDDTQAGIDGEASRRSANPNPADQAGSTSANDRPAGSPGAGGDLGAKAAQGGQADARPGLADAQAGVRVLAALGQKALEGARTNANAAFDHAAALLAARSMADAIELNTAFARRQVEAAAQQAREMTDLVRTAAVESAEPLKARFEAAFKKQD